MRTKSPTRLCVSYLETNSHDILIFFSIFQTLKAKITYKSPASICRNTMYLGVSFLRGALIISGASREPSSSKSSEAGTHRLLPLGAALRATQPVWRRSSSTVTAAAGAFGLCTAAEVQPSPCTTHFCPFSHPQRGLGNQRGCSHAGTTTAKAGCRNWSWANCTKSVTSVLVLAEPEMHLICVEAVLVKWLLCNEYLLLLLDNHEKPTFLRCFLHF